MSTPRPVEAVDAGVAWFNRDVRRLWPDPTESVTPAAQYAAVRHRVGSRPWVGVCMVASLDGSTVVDGRSGALSGPTDHEVLKALRAQADVVLVGAGTVRAEGYGPPRRPGLRIGVVTATGRVDPDIALFTSGSGFVVTTESAPSHGLDAVRAGDETVDLAAALRQLPGVFCQAEGGARLNGELLAQDLVDEVNLTLSPVLAGGDGPRMATGAPARLTHFDLAHVCTDDGFVFLRYVRTGRLNPAT
jgi:riboflavin biosynthesis pyrimidine reductase